MTRVRDLESQIAELAQAEADLRIHDQALAQLNSRLEMIEVVQAAWSSGEAPRLEELKAALEDEAFATEARLQLAAIDAELKAIGYDAVAHDAARQRRKPSRQ